MLLVAAIAVARHLLSLAAEEAAQAVREKIRAEVKAESVSVAFMPPGLRVNSLLMRRGSGILMKVPEVHLQPDPLMLIHPEAARHRVELVGAEVRISRLPDGKWNWDGIIDERQLQGEQSYDIEAPGARIELHTGGGIPDLMLEVSSLKLRLREGRGTLHLSSTPWAIRDRRPLAALLNLDGRIRTRKDYTLHCTARDLDPSLLVPEFDPRSRVSLEASLERYGDELHSEGTLFVPKAVLRSVRHPATAFDLMLDYTLEAVVGGGFRIGGRSKRGEVKISVRDPRHAVRIGRLHFMLAGDGKGDLTIENLRAILQGRHPVKLALEGSIRPEADSHGIELHGKLEELDAKDLADLFAPGGLSLKGRVRTSFTIGGTPEAPSLSATATASSVKCFYAADGDKLTLYLADMRASLGIDEKGELAIEELRFRVDDALEVERCRWEGDTMELEWNLLDWRKLCRLVLEPLDLLGALRGVRSIEALQGNSKIVIEDHRPVEVSSSSRAGRMRIGLGDGTELEIAKSTIVGLRIPLVEHRRPARIDMEFEGAEVSSLRLPRRRMECSGLFGGSISLIPGKGPLGASIHGRHLRGRFRWPQARGCFETETSVIASSKATGGMKIRSSNMRIELDTPFAARIPIAELEAELDAAGRQLRSCTVRLKAGGKVSLRGDELSVQDIEAKSLCSYLGLRNISLRGKISLHARLRGEAWEWKAESSALRVFWRTDGGHKFTVDLRRITARGRAARSSSSGREELLMLKRLEARALGGILTLSGRMEPRVGGHLDLEFTIRDARAKPLSWILNVPNFSMAFGFDAEGRIRGRTDSPVVEAGFRCTSKSGARLFARLERLNLIFQPSTMQGRLTMKSDSIRIHEVKGDFLGGKYTLELERFLAGNAYWKGRFTASDVSISSLERKMNLGRNDVLEGRVKLELYVQGKEDRLDTYSGKGEVEMTDLVIHDFEEKEKFRRRYKLRNLEDWRFDRCSAGLTLLNRKLVFDSIRLEGPTLKARGRITIGFDSSLEGRLKVALDRRHLSNTHKILSLMEGGRYFNFTLVTGGTLSAPSFSYSVPNLKKGALVGGAAVFTPLGPAALFVGGMKRLMGGSRRHSASPGHNGSGKEERRPDDGDEEARK